jgi:thiol-disulfide isomerase/thioredoxin
MNALLYAALAVGVLWLGYVAYVYRLGHAAVGRSVSAAKDDLPGIDAPVGVSLVYFYSEHCPPCRDMTPIVDGLAGERERVYKVDVTARRDLARLFGVRATPMAFVVRDGRIAQALLGAKRRETLLRALDCA